MNRLEDRPGAAGMIRLLDRARYVHVGSYEAVERERSLELRSPEDSPTCGIDCSQYVRNMWSESGAERGVDDFRSVRIDVYVVNSVVEFANGVAHEIEEPRRWYERPVGAGCARVDECSELRGV